MAHTTNLTVDHEHAIFLTLMVMGAFGSRFLAGDVGLRPHALRSPHPHDKSAR